MSISLWKRAYRRIKREFAKRSRPLWSTEPIFISCNEATESFDVEAPWLFSENTTLILNIKDRRLLGSNRYFIRFDLYPLIAPSLFKRHHGFWDIPLHRISSERLELVFHDGKILIKNIQPQLCFKPAWRGVMDFSGYIMMHVSLWEWDMAYNSPKQLAVQSSQHLIYRQGRNLPLEQVTFSITQRCNLACPMCMRHIPESFDASDAPPEILKPLLEASPHFYSVILTGIGEPLLSRNFVDIVMEFKKNLPPEGKVNLTTNGTMMDRTMAARLIDAGVNSICFSIDGATKETYEHIRSGANFETVIRNITSAAEYKRVSGRTDISLTTNFVVQNRNVGEIPAFTQLAASVGLDVVKFSHYRDFKTGEFRILDEDTLQSLFTQAKQIADRCGLKVIVPRLRQLSEPRCEFMQMTYVWLSGEVVPCCRMLQGAYPGPVKIFGNVKNKALLDIWNSAEYSDFRRRVITGDFPDICVRCNYAIGLLC